MPIGREHVAVFQVRGKLAKRPGAGVFECVAVEPRDRPPVDVLDRVVELVDLLHTWHLEERKRPTQSPRAGHVEQGPDAGVGGEHVVAGRLRLDDRRPHPHEVGDPLGMDVPLQEREDDHPSQAVPDPVHPVLSGVSLHVIKDGRHVVTDEVVHRPGRLAPFPKRGLTQEPVDAVLPAGPGVLSRRPDVEDVNLVTASAKLPRKVIVGDRPERRVQPQTMAEDHRQLARIGMSGAVMTYTKSPSIHCVRIAVCARTQIGRRRINAHASASRKGGAKQDDRADVSPTTEHGAAVPSSGQRSRGHPCIPPRQILVGRPDSGNASLLIPLRHSHGSSIAGICVQLEFALIRQGAQKLQGFRAI